MLKFRKDGKFARQYNRYEIKKDYIIGYTNKGEKFYVDKKDFDKIKSFQYLGICVLQICFYLLLFGLSGF